LQEVLENDEAGQHLHVPGGGGGVEGQVDLWLNELRGREGVRIVRAALRKMKDAAQFPSVVIQ
jgi:hypothetical protein